MPRRPPLALALVALAAACAGGPAAEDPAAVAVPPVNGLPVKTLLACRDLSGSLPDELGKDVRRRTTTPASDTTAAWGDPAVTLRCGVPAGSPRDEPYEFDGVRWAAHDNGATRGWTTTGRKVNVVVEVPDAYEAQAELLVRLAPAITRALG